MWFDILKMPIMDEMELDDRFDEFLGNPELFTSQFSTHPYQWQSEDGNARAKFGLDTSKDYPIWYIDVFEISHDERGQGLSRIYLKQLVSEIRNIEDGLDIEEVKRKNPNIGHSSIPPYQIVGKGLWNTSDFWDKMIEEKIVDGYLEDY